MSVDLTTATPNFHHHPAAAATGSAVGLHQQHGGAAAGGAFTEKERANVREMCNVSQVWYNQFSYHY